MRNLLSHAAVEHLLTTSDDDLAAMIAAAKKEEDYCYANYCRAGRLTISTRPGHIHRAGHGTWTTNVSPNGEQEAWYLARDTRETLEHIASGKCHTITRITPTITEFVVRFGCDLYAYYVVCDASHATPRAALQAGGVLCDIRTGWTPEGRRYDEIVPRAE